MNETIIPVTSYPYPGGPYRDAISYIDRLGPGEFYRFGFYVYRTTYDDQPLWDRYIANLHHHIARAFAWEPEADRQILPGAFRLTVVEDPESEGASIEHVRQRFMVWVSNLPSESDEQQELPSAKDRDPITYGYPLYVDSECLTSLERKEIENPSGKTWAEPLVFVKAINAQPECACESEDESIADEADVITLFPEVNADLGDATEDSGDEESDSDEEEERHWMLVTCDDILQYWGCLSITGWDFEYLQCRRPEKTPWLG